jgi:tyrosine-protein kinase Etk/Wzc
MVIAMTGKDFSTEETAAVMDGAYSPEESSHKYRVSMIDVLTHFAQRKWFLAKVTGIALLAGVALALLLPSRYTATTKIMTPQQTPSSATMMMMSQLATTGGGGSMAALAAGGLGLKNPADIYIGLLNSRPIADAIIQKYDLAKAYRAADMTAARNDLADNTKIAAERSGFISVSVTDKDRKRAADMANAYTEQLRDLTKALAVTEASQRRLFYEEQLKEAKEALVVAEIKFQQVQQSKGLVQPEAQAKAMIEGIASLRAEVMAKQVQIQAMRSFSTDQNPEVQLAENQLSSMRSALARMEQHSHSQSFSDLGLEDVPVAGIDYLSAEHELLYRQTLFDLLVKQYDAAKLDEAKEAAIIQVVEPALPPDRRASPKRALIVLLFALVGFLGSCFYLYAKAMLRISPEISESLSGFRSALLSR